MLKSPIWGRAFTGTPVAIGVLTAGWVWWIWGRVLPYPVWHDEAAYLLQAKIFATGRWVAAGRPLPEFFEQFHVIVTPILAAKYFPGHSLALLPGVVVGFPPLMPLALSGLAGATLYVLAREQGGPRVAALAWVVWLLAPLNLIFRPSYLSIVTTSALWLLGWWFALQWRDSRRLLWAALLGGTVGWCAITRPLTAVAYAMPLAGWMLARRSGERWWRGALVASLAGAAVVAILPVWNQRTTGDWRKTPVAYYTQQYMPWDRLGFGLNPSPPARPSSVELDTIAARYRPLHRQHVPAAMPRVFGHRLSAVVQGTWGWMWFVLLPFAVWGLIVASAEARFAAATSLLLVVTYLWYAHTSTWNAYYLEMVPILAFLPVLGMYDLLARLSRMEVGGPVGLRRAIAGGCWVGAGLAFADVAADAVGKRIADQRRQEYPERFARRLDAIPDLPAVVFVQYAPAHNVDQSLVYNQPDLNRANLWVVHDRGLDNERLMRLVPRRSFYCYDEARERLVALPYGAGPIDCRSVTGPALQSTSGS